MDIKKEQEKHKAEEQKKHPMIDLADSVNRSTIGGLSNLHAYFLSAYSIFSLQL